MNNPEDKSICIFEALETKRVKNIFDDEHITFAEISDIFRNIFNGRTNISENTSGQDVFVTCKNGEYRFALKDDEIGKPHPFSEVAKFYKGPQDYSNTFLESMSCLHKALQSLDEQTSNQIFENGRKFLSTKFVYPPANRLIDYGNRCLVQLGGVNVYGADLGVIEEDVESSRKLGEFLSKHNALRNEMCELSRPSALRMKNSAIANDCLQELLGDLSKLVDGIGYNATIQDYVNDRLKRQIVNSATQRGINVSFNSDFVNELANRLSYVSHRRPTKQDLITFAKRDGINTRTPAYADLLETLQTTSDSLNEDIMRPIESLVLKASNLLFENMIGFMAADPSKNSQKIVSELESAITQLTNDGMVLTYSKMKKIRKIVQMLEAYQEQGVFPTEGVVFRFKCKDGVTRTYKLVGSFGPVSQLLRIIGR